jgi:hypothetical protein
MIFSKILEMIVGAIFNRFVEKFLFSWLFKKSDVKHSEQNIIPFKKSDTKSELSQRLSTFVDLLQRNNIHKKFSPSFFAEYFEFEKISDFEKILSGETEPSLAFINHMADEFGANREWLKSGAGKPFAKNNIAISSPLEIINIIDELLPEEVYFVRDTSIEGRCTVFLKMSTNLYKHISCYWHISNQIGGGGFDQLREFYMLQRKLHESGRHLKCFGVVVKEREFDELYNGECYPAKYCVRGAWGQYWFDDFQDIHGRYAISENYEDWYGTSFIKAQEILRNNFKLLSFGAV